MKYVVNSAKINEVIDAYCAMGVDIYYPTKVNFNQKLITIIDSKIKGYEVDSISHTKELIERYNVDPHRILFSYPLKSEEEIRQALSLGVRMFVVDNRYECEFFSNLSSEHNISIIIRISVSSIIEKNLSSFFKWGISLEEYQLLKDVINLSPACLFAGISFYLPQEVNNVNNFKRVLYTLHKEIGLLDCNYLDIGGGFDADTLKIIMPEICRIIDRKNTKIIIEPGRHFAGPCVDMIAEVIAIRIYGGTHVAFLDTGIYNGLLDIIIKGVHFNIVAENKDSTCREYVVCGKSSDVSDVIGRYNLPLSLKVGDKVRICCCGAYCSEMETSFYKENADYELI